MKIPIVVIAGATASGKTALSVKLAKKYGGEIVSADSMQIYKNMNIGTAKPDSKEQAGILHHLMDFIDPIEKYSVADYVLDAHKCIEDIANRGRLPIVTGGTGLYINSLVDDISFEEESGSEEIRKELNRIYKLGGADTLYEMLKEADPESADKIPKENVRRVMRALEFYRANGITISEQNRLSRQKESRYIPLMMAISWERETLYERIEKRVDLMMGAGLLEEVYCLYKKGYTKKMQSMQGIGYKQLLDYFRGLSTLDEAVRIIKRDSRRYAKRQITWFKRDKRIKWISADTDILKNACAYTDMFLAENQQNFRNI